MIPVEAGKHMLAASTGGHLAQLVKWAKIFDSSPDSLLVTFDSPQSRSLAEGRRVMFVPYVAPRDLLGTAKAFEALMSKVDWRREGFSAAVSTGAALGLAGIAAARIHGVPSFYIESVSRAMGPSMTGRLLSIDRGVRTYCQYETWAGPRWRYGGSLFDDFRVVPNPKAGSANPRLFVTLGTIRPYRFDALIDAILATGLADDNTIWQLGVTERSGLPGTSVTLTPQSEFEHFARSADVVVTHAGVGTIMQLLDMGIYPVVVPRSARRGEHIDDHQFQIANVLRDRGIAKVLEVGDISRGSISDAAGRAVEMGRAAGSTGLA